MQHGRLCRDTSGRQGRRARLLCGGAELKLKQKQKYRPKVEITSAIMHQVDERAVFHDFDPSSHARKYNGTPGDAGPSLASRR